MREALASVLSGLSSLQEDDYRERPVDRLHALAAAQQAAINKTARAAHLAGLGVSLIALKVANRSDEMERAVSRLTKHMKDCRPRPNEEMRRKIARQAIFEFVLDFCPRCRGAKEVVDAPGIDGAQRMKPCPPESDGGCGGSGKRRYSDSERMESLGAKEDDLLRIQRQMSYAMSVVGEAEYEALSGAKKMLEKW